MIATISRTRVRIMSDFVVRRFYSAAVTDRYAQPTLAEMGTLLREVTFVVLDLETTGGAPDGNGITEIGAVKVRGGEQLGEFATLVNPARRSRRSSPC